MIYVTGDFHGGYDHRKLSDRRFRQGRKLTKDDYVIVCGDMGLCWDESEEDLRWREWLTQRPWTTLFVDGNHENHALLQALPVEEWHGGQTSVLPGSDVRYLRRGQVFELEGARVLTMGGAQSSDKMWRTEGVSWWPQELPSEAEVDACRASLDACGWEVDYVITHTCGTTLRSSERMMDLVSGRHAEVDRLTDLLAELDERLAFRRWYFGHFHDSEDVDQRHVMLYNAVVPLGGTVADDVCGQGLLWSLFGR